MILFFLALIVIVSAILVNFLQPFKNNRVLIMSILSIMMIMLNFVNQIEIIISPPQIVVKVDSQVEKKGNKQIFKLYFKQQFEPAKMKYLQKEKNLIEQQIKQFQKNSSSASCFSQQPSLSSFQESFSLLQAFPTKSDTKPLTKQQIYLLQQLKNKVIQGQDPIIHIQSIDKIRFQLLFAFFIKDINSKIDNYGLKFDKILFTPIYATNEADKVYKMGEKLNQQDFHFVVVFDKPSEKLLGFLYNAYLENNPPYLSVIFLNLPSTINIFPISSFIEPLDFNQQNSYLQLFADFLFQGSNKKDKRQDKRLVKETQLQLQKVLKVCQKYVQMDFMLLMRLKFERGLKSLGQVCYQKTKKQIPKEIECLRKMIKTPQQGIPYHNAKRCWQGHQQPQQLIKTRDNKIKLRKQHYWSRKVSHINFGLEMVTGQQCSHQL